MMTREWVIRQMYLRFSRRNQVCICPDIRVFGWDSDVVSISDRTGYLTEYELKLVEGDFKVGREREMGVVGGREKRPNRFYYVVPEEFVSRVVVPDYAGLYVAGVDKRSLVFSRERTAPLLHGHSVSAKLRLFLLEACYTRYWNLKLERKETLVSCHRGEAPRAFMI